MKYGPSDTLPLAVGVQKLKMHWCSAKAPAVVVDTCVVVIEDVVEDAADVGGLLTKILAAFDSFSVQSQHILHLDGQDAQGAYLALSTCNNFWVKTSKYRNPVVCLKRVLGNVKEHQHTFILTNIE